MAQAETPAQIYGITREKSSRQSNLKEEIKKKKIRILRIEAPLGIIGVPGSGRKTLAYRFTDMRRGVIQDGEVPVSNVYTATFTGRLDLNRFSIPYDRFIFKLFIYIIDPPVEVPHQGPPAYLERWNDFCCLVFAFDIRNQASFREVSIRLSGYRRENYRVPSCFIAGNKCDTRHDPPYRPVNPADPEYLNQRPVPEWTAYMEAGHLGSSYFECSAKNNTYVDRLLASVTNCALHEQY